MDNASYQFLMRLFGAANLGRIQSYLRERAGIFTEVYLKYRRNAPPPEICTPDFQNHLKNVYYEHEFQYFFSSVSEQVVGLTLEEARARVEFDPPCLEDVRIEAELAEMNKLALENLVRSASAVSPPKLSFGISAN